jgi:DNA polymerase III delta prime subunit
MNIDQYLWVERYRPKTISDCILPVELKQTFQSMVEKGEILNLTLAGASGVGKTSVARALCEELGLEYIVINGSKDSGIDTLRNDVVGFVSTVSMEGTTKVVILDEADRLTAPMQAALRGVIEEFASTSRFILTCNHKNKIIPAIHSRTAVIDFVIPKAERPKLAAKFMERVKAILTENGISFNDKVLVPLVTRYFPDFRRTLGELQRYSVSGTIDEGILANATDINLKGLSDALREKDFTKMRTWIVNNLDNDVQVLFRKIYEIIGEQVTDLPGFVLVLNKYQFQSTWAVDQEVNLVAFCVEIMADFDFKE